jgi:hypothetical protein
MNFYNETFIPSKSNITKIKSKQTALITGLKEASNLTPV